MPVAGNEDIAVIGPLGKLEGLGEGALVRLVVLDRREPLDGENQGRHGAALIVEDKRGVAPFDVEWGILDRDFHDRSFGLRGNRPSYFIDIVSRARYAAPCGRSPLGS